MKKRLSATIAVILALALVLSMSLVFADSESEEYDSSKAAKFIGHSSAEANKVLLGDTIRIRVEAKNIVPSESYVVLSMLEGSTYTSMLEGGTDDVYYAEFDTTGWALGTYLTTKIFLKSTSGEARYDYTREIIMPGEIRDTTVKVVSEMDPVIKKVSCDKRTVVQGEKFAVTFFVENGANMHGDVAFEEATEGTYYSEDLVKVSDDTHQATFDTTGWKAGDYRLLGGTMENAGGIINYRVYYEETEEGEESSTYGLPDDFEELVVSVVEKSSETEPSESPNPSEEPKTSESPDPSDAPNTSVSPKPSESPQPSESAKPSESPAPSESPKPSESAKPVDPEFFVDVEEGSWYEDAVNYCASKGYMEGVGNNKFDPDDTVTRGTIAQILYAQSGKPAVEGKSDFKDVKEDKWYSDAVTWAAEEGVVAGYTDGTYKPEDPITRQQMVAILYKYAQLNGYDTAANGDLGKFKDVDKLSKYAVTPMKWAVGHGVISGTDVGLEPNATATRAQVAVILQAFDKNIKD